MATSDHMSPAALRCIVRLGDILLPRTDELPSFSELGCIDRVDDIVAYAPPGDIKDLNMLLAVLSVAPTGVLRFLTRAMMNPDGWPGPIATLLRMLDVGLRGVIFGLYYSGKKGSAYEGKTPLEIIDFELCRVPRAE